MKVMNASRVGFPCDRNLWYAVNNYAGKVNKKSQRIFDVGAAIEPVVIDWLNQDGWITFYNPGSQEAELELYAPIEGGKIGGHPDCFMSRQNCDNVLADIKTMNERSFINWKRRGTLEDKPQYADQLHCYAYAAKREGFPVDKLAIVGINKNTSDMHIDFFDYDYMRMNKIIERSERIFKLDTPPEPGDRIESWACSYCDYAEHCELCKHKRDTHVDNGALKTNDPDIVNAIELLKEARELSKAGKELEDDAKAVLDVRVRQQGIKSVSTGNYILDLTEIKSSRFDSTSFKKAHPEMIQDFMKNSSSVVYSIKESA
ncbi:MAG: Dna2/Cas4 domain-containing protein [Synergistaceae bacterium]|nr:Dna2/Cas4 domain-containing protein [Synergistaceae bacterium]